MTHRPEALRTNGFRWGLLASAAILIVSVLCCGYFAVALLSDALRVVVRFGEAG